MLPVNEVVGIARRLHHYCRLPDKNSGNI